MAHCAPNEGERGRAASRVGTRVASNPSIEGELERRYGEYPRQVVASIAAGDADAVNYDLLADLVGFFCKLDRDKGRGPEGGNGGREDDRSRDRDRNSDSADAILVFLRCATCASGAARGGDRPQ